METLMRNWSELKLLETFEERFNYLRLPGGDARMSFGHERWLNQKFYTSREWRDVRMRVIARDLGYDLGCEDRPVMKAVEIHHMNPMTVEDLRERNPDILNPEFLICCSAVTHNAIHYGADPPRALSFPERRPGDTIPWR